MSTDFVRSSEVGVSEEYKASQIVSTTERHESLTSARQIANNKSLDAKVTPTKRGASKTLTPEQKFILTKSLLDQHEAYQKIDPKDMAAQRSFRKRAQRKYWCNWSFNLSHILFHREMT